jgi:dihydroflavonol-4-reductase
MKSIDKTKPVLVTGASGYLAGRLIEKLLEEGITVNAAVRDPENIEKLKYLIDLAEAKKGTIKFFKSDLLEPGSYLEAMKDCELVFHTASPFTLSIKDPQKELVDPALLGTRNIIESIYETPSVKRLVLTSSVVAMYGDAIDIQEYPGKIVNESCWNSTSSLKENPYAYSKTLAEKEAWDWQKKQDRWDMVVINPGFIMGPGLRDTSTSESYKFMKQLIDGSSKYGVPYLSFGIVDVRDVALAHFNAGYLENANGRNITCAESLTMLEMANLVNNAFPKKFKLPKTELPKFMVYLFAPFIRLSSSWVKKNVSWPIRFDNSKSKEQLGIQYRPVEDTLKEFTLQLAAEL